MSPVPSPPTRLTLTVVVVCYNHESYIEAALTSVAQQRDVVIDRILVSDDHSPDGTVQRARQVAAGLELPIELRSNTTRLGISGHYQRIFAELDTDLVAVLEGDDYWCDTQKLAAQVAAMARYPMAAATAVSHVLLDEASGTVRGGSYHTGTVTVLGTNELMLDSLPFNTFSAMMYRVSAIRTIPAEFYSVKAYDWIINALVSRCGPVVHLDLPAVVYRLSGRGTWASMDQAGKDAAFAAALESYLPLCPPELTQLVRQRLAQLAAAGPRRVAGWPGFQLNFGTPRLVAGGLEAAADELVLITKACPERNPAEVPSIGFRYSLRPELEASHVAAVLTNGGQSDEQMLAFLVSAAGSVGALSVYLNVGSGWYVAGGPAISGLPLTATLVLQVLDGFYAVSLDGHEVHRWESSQFPLDSRLAESAELGVRWSGATVRQP